MVDFVVISVDLQSYAQVKRGAELSTGHHPGVSWVRWQDRAMFCAEVAVRSCDLKVAGAPVNLLVDSRGAVKLKKSPTGYG